MRVFTNIVLFTLLLWSNAMLGQQTFRSPVVQLLTQKDGLSNNTITDIEQDKNGFMWLGTDIGLSRYDGIHFHNYNRIEQEPYSITNMEETSDNLLWSYAANNKTLLCFDKVFGHYIPLSCDDAQHLKNIQGMTILNDQIYIVNTNGIAKVVVKKEKDHLHLTFHPLNDLKGKITNIKGRNGQLCVVTDNNQLYILTSNGKIIYGLDLKTIGFTENDFIEDIYIFNSTLWICNNQKGILCYDLSTRQHRSLNLTNPQHNETETNVIQITYIDDQNFVAATLNTLYHIEFGGINYLKDNYKVNCLMHADPYHEKILQNRINCIHTDRKNKVLWIGTDGSGLVKLNYGEESVNRIHQEKIIGPINGIAQDSNGYLWLATCGKGIYKSNERELSSNLTFSPVAASAKNGSYCLHEDFNGMLWFGDDHGSILCINPMTGQIETIQLQQGNARHASPIKTLFLNSRGRLWVATRQALIVYDTHAKSIVSYVPHSNQTGWINAICEDGDGEMWLGTRNGLMHGKRTNQEVQLTSGYEEKAGMSPGEVLTLYQNSYNQLFASYTNKIIQIDGKSKSVVSSMILERDLPNGRIKCITDDKNGNTWLGTNSGFITINNRNNALYTYSFPESYYAVSSLNNGQILWASSTGLTYFDPRTLKETSRNRTLFIADIDVNYEKVEIGKEINGQVILDKPSYLMKELTLNHNNNNLIIYLSDLRYGIATQTVEYRLLPHKEWKFSNNERIHLSNIQPGDYTLEIKPLFPIEGNEQTTRLEIHVKKHWATTWLAFAIYVLLLGVVFAYILSIRNHRKLKRELYQAKENELKRQLEKETDIRKEEEKRHQSRDLTRYMLAQELRTPLSLVTAPLKEMLEDRNTPETIRQKAKVAYRNSVNMQDICNQLLDIHLQENNSNQLNVAPYSARSIADEVVRTSYELLNVSSIHLHYDKDTREDCEIWVDRKKIMFILRNILSNAYRHISYDGDIEFKIKLSTINNENHCLFIIEDNGKQHIEESCITYLRTDNNSCSEDKLHPELGTDIMKATAIAHQGDIRIQRDKDKGTQVILYLPIGRDHFQNQENVRFIQPEMQEVTPIVFPESEGVSPQESERKAAADKAVIPQEQKETQPTHPHAKAEAKNKLLIIEDHADIRLYLEVLFAPQYQIVMAENGEEGVKIARKELPDLILTDVMMPVMNGFECCRILKEDLKTCHIPIILLTALVDEKNIVKGIELGADDYILKPFNPEVLRTKVKRLIKSREALKQLYTQLLTPVSPLDNTTKKAEETHEIIPEDPFIAQIIAIVTENLQNHNFNVKRLAEILNMSQPTLYRKVKQLTNFTIVELIRGVRLKHSAELLKKHQYSVQEVAELVGYNDVPTFRKHFVDFYGTTPSTFDDKSEVNGIKK